ncbi:MAG: TrpB-like pyridoxal phosphate-dependent enzyme [Ignisphaera sp.]|uniref:Tryptophan synthase beta chain n=1 Tax=Ignisphaera aggregans TaxID=334771 RepID=A0A7C4JIP3_9CREN
MVNIPKRYLDEILPSYWYNIIPDLPKPLPPPMDPENGSSRIELLQKIVPREILKQQFTIERYVKIPEDVLEKYGIVGRPTPLYRAIGLERYLDTPAKIYFKYEGALPTGSHKINTAIPQVYYAYIEGVERVVTETGAGQWGSAVALAASLYRILSIVFMVRVSYEHKPSRRALMEFYGAEVIPSPSKLTNFGREILSRDPENPGSLGIAISEAIEYTLSHGYRYVIGSVLDVVLLHQSIIGLETIKQMEIIGEEPDVIVACVGGGSNFGGLAYPYIGLRNNGKRFIAVASAEVPKFSKGVYTYDYPDTAGILPLLKMITLGKDFISPPIYSGGLRYHGLAPSLSLLAREGVIECTEVSERDVYRAARIFAETQGIIPAPESAHAVKVVIDIALEAKKRNEKPVILFNMSGHGLLDIENYRSMMIRYGKG